MSGGVSVIARAGVSRHHASLPRQAGDTSRISRAAPASTIHPVSARASWPSDRTTKTGCPGAVVSRSGDLLHGLGELRLVQPRVRAACR